MPTSLKEGNRKHDGKRSETQNGSREAILKEAAASIRPQTETGSEVRDRR